MTYLLTAFIGLIQGLTEFLPVSSSGHLVLAQHLLSIKHESLVLEAVLHLGTALAIVFVYRRDTVSLALDAFSGDSDRRLPSLRYIGLLVLASVPAGIVGVFFKDFFEDVFMQPRIAGAMLMVTALILFASYRARNGGSRPLGPVNALLIGMAQAFAIFPGISRSGSTIAAALLLGIERKAAGRFSFLLALPAICGAVLLQAGEFATLDLPLGALALGFAVSFVSGVAALKLLMRFVEKGRLYYFGFYCLAVGLAAVLLIR